MRKETLWDVIESWEEKAVMPDTRSGNPEDAIYNACDDARAGTYLECADNLRSLITLLSGE